MSLLIIPMGLPLHRLRQQPAQQPALRHLRQQAIQQVALSHLRQQAIRVRQVASLGPETSKFGHRPVRQQLVLHQELRHLPVQHLLV
ncbi:hypothetical protein [Ktedonobacter racemifer]|uniref:hypothetical protein n=1 Tax=Ktedonobacter racemifer TaxID=363277 RepID=UPI0012F85FEE|nr:hypothetical protein [Ktedonobacter racemifer]